MYKALNLANQENILILNPHWLQRIPHLRSLDRQDQLACPVCRKPVRVRAGKLKRPHFAHKHLGNCPYQNESQALLETRAVLYEWLAAQFGQDSVDMEVKLDIPHIRRPVDAWVTATDRPTAYWIIDRRMPPDERERLLQFFEDARMHVHWIFTADMTNPGRSPSTLYLSTTEREFMRHTGFDELHTRGNVKLGNTLHYLDAANREWITYRALMVMHPPQAYHGHQESHPLGMVKARAEDGEPVHPGESARLEQMQQVRQVQEQKEREAAVRLKQWRGKFQVEEIDSGPEMAPFSQEATCVFCGTRTSDWWYYNKADGTCKCYACRDQGRM